MEAMKNIDIGGAKNENIQEGKWKILDILKHVDYVFDLNSGEPLPFKTCSVDNIYCSHTLEHIKPELTVFILSEMLRILKKKGRVRLIVPDIEKGIHLYLERKQKGPAKAYPGIPKHYPKTRLGMLIAWFVTPDKSLQSGHKMGFDHETLEWCLKEAGFTNISHRKYKACSEAFVGKDLKTYATNSVFMEAEK